MALLTFNLGATGKASTTGYTQYDTSGSQTVARTTSGVTEFGSTGVYYVSVTLNASTTLVVWNDTDTGLAGVDDLKPVLPNAQPGAANGVLIAGSNAATTFASVTCTGNFTVDTDVAFGTLTVNGAINVDGALNVTDFTMSSGMSITSALTIGGGVAITQSTLNGHGLSIAGNGTGHTVYLSGALYSIFTAGSIDIGGSIAVTDDFTIDGTLAANTSQIAWNPAWDAAVQSEVQDAIEANHLDHLLAADYDPASKPGVSTALLNELIGSDAGVSQFTANALELAPSGGGGGGGTDWTADERTAIRSILGIPASGTTPDDPTTGILDTVRDLVVVVDTVVDGIKVKTDYLPSATAGAAGGVLIAGSNAATTFSTLTVTTNDMAWNAAWDAEVQSEVADALTVYDPPTNTEMVAAFTEIKGATWSSATDTLEAIRDRGDDAWVKSTGTGARSVTVTVNSGGSPVGGALVRLVSQSTSESFTGNTVGGVVAFSLDDATYNVTITLANHTFTPTTLVVNGTETPTYSITAVTSPTPSAPELCVVTGTFVDPNNEPLVGVVITFELQAARNSTTSGYLVQSTEWTVTTDAQGEISTELVRTDQFRRPNAHYLVSCTELGWSKKRLTLATGAYDLSSL